VFHLNTDRTLIARLADVKAQIEQDQRDRAQRTGAL
jgi:hypothetical protein